MRLVDSHTGIELIEEAECVRLLGTCEFGRVGFVSGGCAEVLPVNYVLDGNAIVFATGPGVKHSHIPGRSVVFEVDDTDRATRSGWSVIVRGVADDVTEHSGRALFERVMALGLDPWARGPKPHLIRIAPSRITGRRICPD